VRVQQLDLPAAFASLRSRPEGLTGAEARERLIEFGPNRLRDVRRTPLVLRLLRQLTHAFALILWIAAGLAWFAAWRDPAGGMGALAAAIVGVISVNAAFSFWQEYRAERAIEALQRLLPDEITALRDGRAARIAAAALVPGDVVHLEAGDVVPADCRMVAGEGVRISLAAITGEAAALARSPAPVPEERITIARNVLLGGAPVLTGRATALVFATGMHTEFGRIAELTGQAPEPPTPLQREIARVSRIVAALATIVGVGCFVAGHLLGLPFWGNLVFAVGIIVANVPEGLLPTVTLALAAGAQRMARRRALVRHLPAVETMGAASVICTDKTGTLTENRMAVRRLWLAGRWHDVAAPEARDGLAARRLWEGALWCHDLEIVERAGRTEVHGDPMEMALVEAARRAIHEAGAPWRAGEVPFDTERKRLAVLLRAPDGLALYVKGALEPLLPHCTGIAEGEGVAPLTDERRADLLAAQQQLAGEGYRVLAFAWRAAPDGVAAEQLERDLVLCGLVGLEDPPRPEVPDAVRRCREAGIRVIMVTGDHPSTAVAIARQIGLVTTTDPRVVRGDTLRRMSDTQLQLALDAPEVVFARIEPEQKLRIVTVLQRKGATVAVTGDGVNDAPALRRADVGIAMGATGTAVAREAADIVLADDNFASIVAAVEEGRAVFSNMRKFLTYILTSNVPELVPYLGYALLGWPLALTIIQILAVDLGTDLLPALGLGAERANPDVMRRPPRSPSTRLLTPGLLARAYAFLGPLEAAAALAAFFFVLRLGGWTLGEPLGRATPLYLQGTTACLAAIVMMQVVNVFNCRSARRSALSFGLLSNRLILAGIALEIVLILFIVYTPSGNRLLGAAPLPAAAWAYMVPFAAALLVLEEARKWLARRA